MLNGNCNNCNLLFLEEKVKFKPVAYLLSWDFHISHRILSMYNVIIIVLPNLGSEKKVQTCCLLSLSDFQNSHLITSKCNVVSLIFKSTLLSPLYMSYNMILLLIEL